MNQALIVLTIYSHTGHCLLLDQLFGRTNKMLLLTLLQIFIGNTDRNTVVKNDLETPLNTRWLRFLPKSWNNNIAMRVEVYGC